MTRAVSPSGVASDARAGADSGRLGSCVRCRSPSLSVRRRTQWSASLRVPRERRRDSGGHNGADGFLDELLVRLGTEFDRRLAADPRAVLKGESTDGRLTFPLEPTPFIRPRRPLWDAATSSNPCNPFPSSVARSRRRSPASSPPRRSSSSPERPGSSSASGRSNPSPSSGSSSSISARRLTRRLAELKKGYDRASRPRSRSAYPGFYLRFTPELSKFLKRCLEPATGRARPRARARARPEARRVRGHLHQGLLGRPTPREPRHEVAGHPLAEGRRRA